MSLKEFKIMRRNKNEEGSLHANTVSYVTFPTIRPSLNL